MESKEYYPDSIAYKVALEFAKEAVGTDVKFFPRRSVMIVHWNIHADAISKAMELAYLIGSGHSKNSLVLVDEPEEHSCGECSGMLYHHPDCSHI